jgi:cytochrome d ubiquinol oxidase subunit I
MDFDPVLLARLQFAFTIVFHIIFPSFTIGLSAYLATLGALWLRTGNDRYQQLMRFWTRIFAVSFAMGVVSGIVLSYQFGTNWSRFSLVVGNVVGPLIGYEVLSAFFLEATFLGVLLFGFNRVPPWLYVLSAAIVAVGTAISAFWILSANSWMQTPTGHQMIGGIAHPADWLAIVFNPSFPYRFAHMLTAAYLTTAFVVLAVGARYLVARRHEADGRTMVRMAIGMIAVLAPLQLFIGDQHGLNTLKYQPMKIAAVEGHWDGSEPGALVLFAWPDEKTETNRFEFAIPKAGSLIVTHDLNGLFPGLKSVPPQDRPPVKSVFFAFRAFAARSGAVARRTGTCICSETPRGLPGIDLLLGLVAGDTVALLDLTDQLLAFALNLIEIIVGELPPLLSNSSLQLGPLALECVFVHRDLRPLVM